MVTPVVTYREASHSLLGQAHAELDAGDLRQASEKAWGAAAQIVKAAAQLRGWEHDHSHRGLFLTINQLTDEVGDPEIHDLFIFANGLHMNFYENTFGADRGRPLIIWFIRRSSSPKLDVILDSPPSNSL